MVVWMVVVLFCGLVFVPHAPHFIWGISRQVAKGAGGGVLNLDTWYRGDFCDG